MSNTSPTSPQGQGQGTLPTASSTGTAGVNDTRQQLQREEEAAAKLARNEIYKKLPANVHDALMDLSIALQTLNSLNGADDYMVNWLGRATPDVTGADNWDNAVLNTISIQIGNDAATPINVLDSTDNVKSNYKQLREYLKVRSNNTDGDDEGGYQVPRLTPNTGPLSRFSNRARTDANRINSGDAEREQRRQRTAQVATQVNTPGGKSRRKQSKQNKKRNQSRNKRN